MLVSLPQELAGWIVACVEQKKILVAGTGGIGGYFGGRLANYGYDVTFLARGKHYEAIQSSGLHVSSVIGDFVINPAHVVDDVRKAPRPDLVLFCVKAYDTATVAPQLNEVLTDRSIVVSLQNGVENDELIGKHISQGRVFPGWAHIITTKVGPGQITQTAGPRELIFGDRRNEHLDELHELCDLMKKANIDARVSTNVEAELWHKFIFIATFSGLTSLYRAPIGTIINNPVTFELYKKSVLESIAVARACSIPIPDDTYDRIMTRTEGYRGSQGVSKSSMLKDIEAGRPTEIDHLSGAIARMGRERGVATPIHDTIRQAVLVATTTQNSQNDLNPPAPLRQNGMPSVPRIDALEEHLA